jgi:hypothetical protein
MLKVLGDSRLQYVERNSTSSGISSLLTHSQNNLFSMVWLQVEVYDLFVRCLWTSASTVLRGYFTSLNNYLYPLSTVPITITTNINKLIIVRSDNK